MDKWDEIVRQVIKDGTGIADAGGKEYHMDEIEEGLCNALRVHVREAYGKMKAEFMDMASKCSGSGAPLQANTWQRAADQCSRMMERECPTTSEPK